MTEPIAMMNLLRMTSGEPGVQFLASPDFVSLGPVEQCMYIAAAVQLSSVLISAICKEHPDVAEEIMERFGSITLEPAKQSVN